MERESKFPIKSTFQGAEYGIRCYAVIENGKSVKCDWREYNWEEEEHEAAAK